MTVLKVPGMRSLLTAYFGSTKRVLEKNIEGMTFKNPVGLAAGFDKNARFLHAMSVLGFSHVEIGTVTPRPQDGNPKPRLFRLKQSEGLINRMGFNNDGVDVIARRLQHKRPAGLIVGANIGKNKDTPNEHAVDDYLHSFQQLYPFVDYFTVNVSSPNTPNLRALQDKEPLTQLLSTLQQHNTGHKPVFLKIAPDLTESQLDEIVEIVTDTKITGIIATNTTITREHLKESEAEVSAIGAGGLSGKPIHQKSVQVVRYIATRSHAQFVIIGAGGISDAATAKAHLDAGADLIQVYSGLIYAGPMLVSRILRSL